MSSNQSLDAAPHRLVNHEAVSKARHFIENERQFHLGFLPTEQSHPKTRTLDATFAESTAAGVRMLQSVDRDVLHMAEAVFGSAEFALLCDTLHQALSSGRRVVFSGCGATGRLSILLESMWHRFFINLKKERPEVHLALHAYENLVFSIMTGGDFALLRSVESFEDYHEFGCQQVREMGMGPGDVLVAITEGGETSSVLGTVEEAAACGASVFLLFNNPAHLLSERLERSRRGIELPGVTVLDLHCGPMAIAGSTRMQATTSEQLIAGAALETTLGRLLRSVGGAAARDLLPADGYDYAAAFSGLLDDLGRPEAVAAIAEYVEFEESVYTQKGLVTYYANAALLDIFTDTTERAPTFMLPPFRKKDDLLSPPSWAFVKNPLLDTPATWEAMLGRKPRCLDWTSETYREMGASEKIIANPPLIGGGEILKFEIGSEEDGSRVAPKTNAAVMIVTASEAGGAGFPLFEESFNKAARRHAVTKGLVIGEFHGEGYMAIPCRPGKSLLSLMEHLAVKLVLNTISSGTMVRLGKVTGNWMSFVEVSNKKLLDRSTRIIAELCGLSYEDACVALHETMEELAVAPPGKPRERVSPVQHTIKKKRTAKV